MTTLAVSKADQGKRLAAEAALTSAIDRWNAAAIGDALASLTLIEEKASALRDLLDEQLLACIYRPRTG